MDIINILDQTKRFLETEKGTLLGLFVTIVAEVIILKFFVEALPWFEPYTPHILVGLIIITFLVWLHARHIVVDKYKFSIGIGFFDLLSLDIKQMSSEAKYAIEKELSNFLYHSSNTHIRKLKAGPHIEIIQLPRRIKPRFDNARSILKKHDLGMLVWFETFYESGKVIIEPQFMFVKEPTNTFYAKFKELLKNFRTFTVNIKEPMHRENDISYLLHDLIYLGLIFQGINYSAQGKFVQAHKSFDLCLYNIEHGKLKSDILHRLYWAGKYFEARSYHQWGNSILHEKNNRKHANVYYEKAAKILLKKGETLKNNKKYKKEEYFENSYLYAISLLTKAGKYTEAKRWTTKLKKYFVSNAEYYLFLAEIEKNRNTKLAEKYYKQAIKSKSHNPIVYEKIGKYFFQHHDYDKAITYFNERLRLTEKRAFQPDLYEEEDHILLIKSHLKQHNIGQANKEIRTYLKNHFKNSYLEKQYFDLEK